MSVEVARFLDNTEYSTNAIIIPQKSYRHPALRESALAYTVYGTSAILVAKVQKNLERNAFCSKKLQERVELYRKNVARKAIISNTYLTHKSRLTSIL
jgi:hypothetical protein